MVLGLPADYAESVLYGYLQEKKISPADYADLRRVCFVWISAGEEDIAR